VIISPSLVVAAIAKRCAFCSSPAVARCAPEPERSASSRRLIVTSREELRHQLRRHDTDDLVGAAPGCGRSRRTPPSTRDRDRTAPHRQTDPDARGEANDLESEIEQLIKANVPWLLDEIGVGPISAAQLFFSWSHASRLRSEAAFAMLGGAAPIPASSGQTIRYRLNRRRPPAQLRAAHHCPHPPAARPRRPRLRR
jgi:transposase